jgi:pilus assembly protein CpaB
MVILGVSLLTMVGAYFFVSPAPAPAPVVQAQAPAPSPSTEVLVAAQELPMGNGVTQGDIRWIGWPQDLVPPGSITRRDQAIVEREVIGALVRSAFVQGEPIRREKLIRADGSGYLSAMLPAGRRAVAINIDRTGSSSAGGFILPNDRVDVVFVGQGGRTGENLSQTIISNIRVLAIAQNVQDRNGEKVILGETATLELDPRQTEVISAAQRNGSVALALRSLADANEPQSEAEQQSRALTIVRFGVPAQSARQ